MFISLRGLTKAFAGAIAVRDCSVDLERGEFLTLLGPSGCGKTTLLRMVAGFVEPDSGEIRIGDRNVTRIPPNRRDIGLVFQSYALFPHLTVAQNVGYGLMVRGVGRAERDERVRKALQLVDLASFSDRWPRQLSGGQQQRVALARSLILEPQLLLLDEPFGALDAKLRLAMQVDVKQLVARLAMTTIFVTHDQDEALTMSDRIAVMRAGAIEQIGAPLEIYDAPATPFVADFIGASNIFEVVAKNGAVELAPGVVLPTAVAGPATVVIRPENLTLSPESSGAWRGDVRFVKHLGPTTLYRVSAGGAELSALVLREQGAAPLAVNSPVSIGVRRANECRILAKPAP